MKIKKEMLNATRHMMKSVLTFISLSAEMHLGTTTMAKICTISSRDNVIYIY